MNGIRALTGNAGIDRRGLWIDDAGAGFKFRLGEVGYDLAKMFTESWNTALSREALSKPYIGFTVQKSF